MARLRRIAIAAAFPAILLALVIHFGDRLFYYPSRAEYRSAGTYGVKVEEVTFAAPGGPKLAGFWMRAESPARGAVVFCHGNAGNVTSHASFVTWLPRRGFDVLVFDYRGYGRSEGRVTREGTVADAIAAIDFTLARAPRRTVVFGHSLGGAVAIVAAAERPDVRAVAVEAAFPSYRKAARAAFPLLAPIVPLAVSDGLDPEDVLARIPPRPLLVIHGSADRTVPFRLGRELFELASEPKRFHEVEGGDHETARQAGGRKYETAILEFFGSSLGGG